MLFSFEQFSLVSPFRFVRFKSSRGGMWIATLPFGRSQWRKKGGKFFWGVGRGKIEKALPYLLLTDEGTRNNHLFSPFSRGGMWIATLRSQWRVWGHWIATLPFGRSQWRKKGESSFEGRDKSAIFVGRSERGRDKGAIFVGRSERGRDEEECGLH